MEKPAEAVRCEAVVPFLRWAGSKRKILPALKSYYRNDSLRYVEPFLGSGCLYFSLRPAKAILGDVNKELISTYLEVKYRYAAISDQLRVLRRSRAKYMALRAQLPAELDSTSRATRFLYLNRYCFNGLYRTNNSGIFNVPFGRGATGQLPSGEELKALSEVIGKRPTYLRRLFPDPLFSAERRFLLYGPAVRDTFQTSFSGIR